MMSTFCRTILLKLWRVLPFPQQLRWMFVWPFQRKFLVGLAAIVLNQQGQILLFHHDYRPQNPWGLPSGWLGRGEQPEAAILREIGEETGLIARVIRPLFVQADLVWPRLDIIFYCLLEGGQFAPSPEVSQVCFFDLQALPELSASQQRIIQKALEVINSWEVLPEAGPGQNRL